MTGLLFVATASLLFVLMTPDSISRRSELKTATLATVEKKPRQAWVSARPGISLNELRFEVQSIPTWRIGAGGMTSLTPTSVNDPRPIVQALPANMPFALPSPVEHPTDRPIDTVAATQRVAVVNSSGRQIVDRLRRRREKWLDIRNAYQPALAA